MKSSVPVGPPGFRFKLPREPMLWAVIAHSLGIVAGFYLYRPLSWWIISAVAFLAFGSFFIHRRVWIAFPLALGMLFFVGALHIQVRAPYPHLNTEIQAFADGQEIEVTGHAVRDGRLRINPDGEVSQSVDIETEEIVKETGERVVLSSGVRLTMYLPRDAPVEVAGAGRNSEHAAMRILQYGERIRFSAKLRPPRNFRNPGAFDYEGYLASRGIAALASSRADNVEPLSGFAGYQIEHWRTGVHRRVVGKVHELWPPRQAALIDAMVIGEEAFIDRDTRVDFQRSGTYHVLVVSGMNVSILAFVAFWTMRRLRIGDFPATLLTVSFCFAYAFLTDVGAPVWRATLMCTVYLGTRLLFRQRAILNALGTAAIGLLVLDPWQLFTASFQMTFVCVLIVAAIGLPILERTSQLYKHALNHWQSPDYLRALPPRVAQFRLDLGLVAGRMARFVGAKWAAALVRGTARLLLSASELIFISAVMQMGLALPMAYYFHRATTIGLPANILIVPLTELMMPAAITAIGCGFISKAMAVIPAAITGLALQGITSMVHGMGGLHLADVRVAMPSLVMLWAAAGALVSAMVLARRRMVLAVWGLLVILVAAMSLTVIAPHPEIHRNFLELTSIDVGQGDSTLLISPTGRTLLLDSGGPIGPGTSQLDFGEDVVSPYLWSRHISRLDAVAVTHGHSDHMGGMPAILRNFRPTELWIGLLPPSQALDALIVEARSLGIPVVRHWQGDEFDFGGARVQVLFPPKDRPVGRQPQNNDSMVLRVSYGPSAVLLEGDAQKQVERQIAPRQHLQADVLRVGHHGSADATTQDLLDAVQPKWAVISVGSRNSFGLPRTDVLDRLSAAGARVYRTDIDGATTFLLDGHSVTTSLAVLR